MISKTVVTVPFGTHAVVRRKGQRKDVDAVLMRPVALEVETVEARHLRPAATVTGPQRANTPGQVVEETVWTMDDRLFAPLGLNRTTGERTSLTANRIVPYFAVQQHSWDLPAELPDAVVTPHAFEMDGRWQRPEFVDENERGLRLMGEPDAAEAASRLASLQWRLLVVDGEVWSECPAPRLFAVQRTASVIAVPSCGIFDAVTGHGGISELGFQFSLNRLAEAERCAEIIDPAPAPERQRRPPRFEVHDYDAIDIDGASASVFHAGPSLERELSRYVAGFSDAGIEAYMQIRNAVRSLHGKDDGPLPTYYGSVDEVALFHTACERLAEETGYQRSLGPRLAEEMPPWLSSALGHFGRRYRELEAAVEADYVLELPHP